MSGVQKQPSAYEAVDVESAERLIPPSPQVTRWRLLVGSVAAVGAVVLIGLNQFGAFASQPAHSPLAHLTHMQDNLMSAFLSRALSDTNTDFNLASEILLNEDGAKAPNAMGVTADMVVGDSSDKWPQMTVTFAAADGKQDALKDKLDKLWADVVEMEKKQSGPKSAKQLEELASITKGRGNGVLFNLRFPKGPGASADDKQMMAEFKKHHPTFHAELSFGRTIKQMFDNIDSNMVMLPNGVHAKVGTGIASTVFDMIGDAVPRDVAPMLSMMKGFSLFSASEKMIYKHGADKVFDAVPTLKNEVEGVKSMVRHGPPKLTRHLKGLDKLMTGISGITVTGLPLGWEVDAKFSHFHPSPVLAAMVPDDA